MSAELREALDRRLKMFTGLVFTTPLRIKVLNEIEEVLSETRLGSIQIDEQTLLSLSDSPPTKAISHYSLQEIKDKLNKAEIQ